MTITKLKNRSGSINPLLILAVLFLLLCCCNKNNKEEIELVITNENDFPLSDYIFDIDVQDQLNTDWINQGDLDIVWDKKHLPAQVIEIDENLTQRKILVQIDLPADTTLTLQLRKRGEADSLVFRKQTLAELCYKTGGYFENNVYMEGSKFKSFRSLRVPDECNDHSFFIKYEGPGWESDKVGYRLYLDWRNAIDIYGKKVDTIVLPYVGQDGYESYHEMADWGMDILKVGNSLGIGTLGFWDETNAHRVAKTDSVYCTIKENGNLYSEILIDYYGWKIDSTSVDLHTSLSIKAGSRATNYTIRYDGALRNLCTGIVKSDSAELIPGPNETGWNYLATWGKQSLAGDMLGMAIVYQNKDYLKLVEDENSHVLVFKPKNNQLEYYFLAAWEKEPEGIKTKEDFMNCLDQYTQTLNHPSLIQIMNK